MAKIPPELKLSEIVTRLTAAQVDFVVIGGIAVVLHGSARNTVDLDITYDTAHENLVRLGQVLVGLGARLRGIEEQVPFVPDARTLRQVSLLTFDTDAGWLDLLAQPPGGPSYPQLRANATSMDLDGVVVRVASLEDMLAMKQVAGRLRDRADIDEIETIRRLRARCAG